MSGDHAQNLTAIWVYLSASPLLGLTVTLLAYQFAVWLNRRCHGHPLVNPVLVSVLVLALLLQITGTDYRRYFDGAQFVHFLLGPATVALAIPLHAQLPRLRGMAVPLLLALCGGSLTAAAGAVLCAWALGGSMATIYSLAPKSVTTPIAMGIAERLGGLPEMTAVLVILTGVIGAVTAQAVFRLLPPLRQPGQHHDAVRGFALGITAHGIGTAHAFTLSQQAGAFAALGMGLNGLLTALYLPLLVPLLAG